MHRAFILVFVVNLTFPGIVVAASEIVRHVFGGGGDSTMVGTTTVRATLGQPCIQSGVGPTTFLNPGFWIFPSTDVSPVLEDRIPAGQRVIDFDVSPTPFNSSTTIHFKLAQSVNWMTLRIYDIRGHLVRNLIDGPGKQGLQIVGWDGLDWNGNAVGSGIYLAVLNVDGKQFNHKITLVK